VNAKRISSILVFLLLLSGLPGQFFNLKVPTVKAQTADARSSNVFGNPSLPNWLNITVEEDSDFVVVDNADGFVWKFRKGTAGYNEVWQNGHLIVQDERWVLQYLAQARWKQRGVPQYVLWSQPQHYRVIVKRFYRDWGEPETTFNVTYSFYGGFRPKISLEANIGQADAYRVKWTISGINKTYVENEPSKYHVKFWNIDEEAVCFDYSDVYEVFGDITDIELDVWAGNHKLNEIFNVGVLQVGGFKLDPNFGYETLGTIASDIENRIKGSVFTISEDGTADSITVGLKWISSAWTGNVKCAIYEHSDLTLVAPTQERNLQLTSTATWYTFNFSAPKPDLTANSEYILCVWGQSVAGTAVTVYEVGNTNQAHVQTVVYNNFPNPLVPTHGTAKYSIYCTYTTGGGQQYSRSVNQTLSASAEPVRRVTASRQIFQQISPSSVSSRLVTFLRTLFESLILSTSGKGARIHIRSVQQPLTISLDVTKLFKATRFSQQSVNLSTAMQRWTSICRSVKQKVTIDFSKLVSYTPYSLPILPPSPFPKLLYFDISIFEIPTYLVQFPFVSMDVKITIVNKNLEATDVTFRYWVTDAKTGEVVIENTETIFISGLDKKDITVKVPYPTKEGDYTFHIAIQEPKNIVVSGVTTRTFKVYSLVQWLFFGEGVIILAIVIIIAVLITLAWLKHEEYI